MPRVSPQLIVFSYHKTGTTLFWHVMTKVCERLGLRLANHYGRVDQLELEPDVVLLPHSLLSGPLDRPFRAIRMIRDPRDIWVSGYLYHRRSVEEWCINSDLDTTPPILWPKVDHSVAHRPEAWKRAFLERLGGRSYQQNLLDRSPADGLDFELQGYTGWTLAAMREWRRTGVEALDVKLEDVMADFDGVMRRIFRYFGLTEEQQRVALEVARSEDVRRMDEAALGERPQVYSRTISKWQGVLSRGQVAQFEATYGDLIQDLGYELAGAAPNPPVVPRGPAAAGIRLVADGNTIHATRGGRSTYIFIVPAGRARVVMEACRGTLGMGAPGTLGSFSVEEGPLKLRVNQIEVQSGSGEVVIPVDDPRLLMGWSDDLGRQTLLSAELPWTGILGAAIVTIKCII